MRYEPGRLSNRKRNWSRKGAKSAELLESLSSSLKEIARELSQQGFPVGEDCRIDMKKFEGVYATNEIEKELIN